jgi:hypothetical protein
MAVKEEFALKLVKKCLKSFFSLKKAITIGDQSLAIKALRMQSRSAWPACAGPSDADESIVLRLLRLREI